MELTTEEKQLIHTEVDNKIKEFKTAIAVLNSYKWLGGILLVLLGITGFWGINEFIDRKVAERIKLYNNYYFALNSLNTKNYNDAYYALTSSWKEINEKKYEITNEFKKSYYSNLLNILINLDEPNVNYDIQNGSSVWQELKNDKDFLAYKETLNNDCYGLENYGLCELKYEAGNSQNLNRFENFIHRAIELRGTEGKEDKAGWYFYLIQVNLIKGNKKGASDYAAILKNTSFRDYLNYKKESISFENTIYGDYWIRFFDKFNPNGNKKAFIENYKSLYNDK